MALGKIDPLYVKCPKYFMPENSVLVQVRYSNPASPHRSHFAGCLRLAIVSMG